MPHGIYDHVRFRMIARELEDQIRSGELAKGTRFYTREEIMRRYGISPVTAFRVLKYLESDGMISCGRGHRAILLEGREDQPGYCPRSHLKIVLSACTNGPGVPDTGLEWLVNCLKNRLKNDGQTVLMWDGSGELPESDGCLLLLERETYPDLYKKRRESGKPFCMLTGRHCSENTAFFLPQLSLNQMLLYFAARHVRKLHVLRGLNSPFDRMLIPVSGGILPPEYGIEIQEEGVFSSMNGEDGETINRLLRSAASAGDHAVFCPNPVLAENVWDRIVSMRIRGLLLAGTGGVISGRMPYPEINWNLPDFSRFFLDMLYRQFRTGQVRDPGFLQQPLFQLPE